MRIQSKKDFYAGLLFTFSGLFALLVARRYPVGTAARMGAGYFPYLLGGALAVLGLVIVVRSLWGRGEPVHPLALRPLLLVTGAVIAFALLVRPLGLVLATLTLVVTGSLGNTEFRMGEVAVLCLVLTGMAVVLFAWALGIPFNIWPV
jgi:hypothetical protein